MPTCVLMPTRLLELGLDTRIIHQKHKKSAKVEFRLELSWECHALF